MGAMGIPRHLGDSTLSDLGHSHNAIKGIGGDQARVIQPPEPGLGTVSASSCPKRNPPREFVWSLAPTQYNTILLASSALAFSVNLKKMCITCEQHIVFHHSRCCCTQFVFFQNTKNTGKTRNLQRCLKQLHLEYWPSRAPKSPRLTSGGKSRSLGKTVASFYDLQVAIKMDKRWSKYVKVLTYTKIC